MKNWVRRAIRTFAQTFCGVVSAELVVVCSGVADLQELKTGVVALGASAVAAGIAAVMNMKEGNE